MGCGASVSHKSTSDVKAASINNEIISKKQEVIPTDRNNDIEDFVTTCLTTGNLVSSVKRFLSDESSSETFLLFLKSENLEENGQFFKVCV